MKSRLAGWQQLGAAAEKKAQRQWHYCRRENGFSDKPLWRMIANRLGMPAYQVIAFAHRLEEHANAAGNTGTRGEVTAFSAEEFGLALGMPAPDAEAIFVALEQIGWIVEGCIHDFFDRNRDGDAEDKEAVRMRKRRERARDKGRKLLAQLARLGLIDRQNRDLIEIALPHTREPALFNVVAQLDSALAHRSAISADAVGLSTCHAVTDVTRDAVDNSAAPKKGEQHQRAHAFHMSRRDTVTVTPEKSKVLSPPVEDSGDGANGASEGWREEEHDGGEANDPHTAAHAWLSSTGLKIVTGRLDEPRTKAATRIERWLNQGLNGDAVALRAIVEAAHATDVSMARFLVLITEGIAQHKHRAAPRLHFGPAPIAGERRGSGT